MRRRRPLTGRAAVDQKVADLWNEFEYPDEDTPPGAPFTGGAGGAPTVVVAASDATELSKSKADLICTGLNDHETIQAAIDLTPGFGIGGRVLLTEGNYHCEYGGIDAGFARSIHVQGMGKASTRLHFDGGSGPGINVTFLSDVYVASAASTTDPAIQVGRRVLRCRIAGSGPGIDVVASGGGYMQIDGCFIVCDGVGIDATPSSAVGLIISNNHFQNTGDHAIRAANVDGLVIADNFINIFTGINIDTISITGNVDRLAMTGNNVFATSSSHAIAVSGSGHAHWLIADNFLQSALNGVDLSSATIAGLNINDNTISVSGVGISIDGGTVEGQVTGNVIDTPGQHGIYINDTSDLTISGNHIIEPGGQTDNTFDGIQLAGDSDLNYVHGNKITPSKIANDTRFGINIADATCECNVVVGNMLGPATEYGTDALNDSGSGTQLHYPAGAYGDNFTGCLGS